MLMERKCKFSVEIKKVKKFVSTTSARHQDAMLVMEAKDEFEEIGTHHTIFKLFGRVQ